MISLSLSSRLEAFGQLLTLLIIFIFVLALTYYVTRFAGRIQKTKMVGKNIEILETMQVSNSKYIQIVRIGDRCVAMAVCKDTMSYICDVNEDSLTYSENSSKINADGFKDILNKFKRENQENGTEDAESVSDSKDYKKDKPDN